MLPQIEIWKDAFCVNNRANETQNDSKVIGLANGNFLVVWTDANDTTAPARSEDIVGQMFDAAGQQIGGEVVLNEGFSETRDERLSSVAATADGGFVLTYLADAGNDEDQQYRLFDANGDLLDNEVVLDDGVGAPVFQDYEIVHVADTGVSVVTYVNNNNSDEQIAFRTIDSTGVVSDEIILRADDTPTGDLLRGPAQPTAAVLKNGAVVVAYRAEDGGVYGPEFNIISPTGTVDAHAFVDVDTPAGQSNVDVAALKGGGFVVTWMIGTTLQGRVYNNAGTPRTEVVDLVTGGNTLADPKVVQLDDGGFGLAWLNMTQDEVSMRTFDATGAATTAKADVPFDGASASALDMSTTADGRVVLTWSDQDASGDDDVYSAVLDPRSGTIKVADGVATAATQSGGKINGTGGKDTVYGQDGNDDINGKSGQDNLSGGKGADDLSGGGGADRLTLGQGSDTGTGDGGDDLIFGGKGNDVLTGGAGGDRLRGEDNNDILKGGTGADKMFGGAGADKLFGGAGRDVMAGNGGADTFIFKTAGETKAGSATRDVIDGFKRGADQINLKLIDADTTKGGNQAFDFIGSSKFGDAGDLRIKDAGKNLIVQGDRDGDGKADFEIRLDDLGQLGSGDFIL